MDLKEIDFVTDLELPLADFDSEEEAPPEIMAAVRETACEQGLFYQDRRSEMVDRYRGKFVYLQDGKVIWDGLDPSHLRSHRDFGGGSKPASARWLKLVDPEEMEGERFEVYDDCLHRMRAWEC